MTLVTAGDMIHINRMRFVPVFLILCSLTVALPLALPAQAFAQPSKGELGKIQTELDAQKKKQQELAQNHRDIRKKIAAMQAELIDVGASIQQHENVLLKLQDAQTRTGMEIAEASENLAEQKETLVQTLIALQRLNRMPPQALLARPSAPIEMARSFGLLQQIIPAISEQARDIQVAFDALQALQATQKRQEQDLNEEKQALATRQGRLEKLLTQRRALAKDTARQEKQAAKEVAALAGKARDLKELVARLEKEAKARRVQEKAREKAPEIAAMTESPDPEAPRLVGKMKNWLGAVVSNLGNARLPVAGRIATAYGQRSGEIVSQGITIAARPGAIVTAPSAGTIRFAGPFRHYKLLVIIQHPNGEHSLLGGLQEIYTTTGAKVAAGEPLGKLPNKSNINTKLAGDSAAQSSLYYERRRHGKPIDPRSARG